MALAAPPRTPLPARVVVLRCQDGVQSEEVAKLNTGQDAAYRLLMHPSGRALVCGMSVGGLERVDLQPASAGSTEPPKLALSQGGPGQGCWGAGGCLLCRLRRPGRGRDQQAARMPC